MRIIATLAVAILAALSPTVPATAETLCYYWVDQDGIITSYQTPPFDIATPASLAAEDGSRLIIAPSRRCRDNEVLNAPPPQAAVTPPPERTLPAPTFGDPVQPLRPVPEPTPEPTPEFQLEPDFQLEPLQPQPEPQAEPAPDFQFQPVPRLEPESEPESEPPPETELDTVPESQPTPLPELRLEPATVSGIGAKPARNA